jgi:hypothetical protein
MSFFKLIKTDGGPMMYHCVRVWEYRYESKSLPASHPEGRSLKSKNLSLMGSNKGKTLRSRLGFALYMVSDLGFE